MAEKTSAASAKKRPPIRKEVAEAIKEAKETVDEVREQQASPELFARERAAAVAVQAANDLSVDAVVKSIGEVKLNVGRTLSELSDRLEEQVRRYRQLSDAITVKEKELSEVFEIERSAGTLLSIVQAQRDKQEQFEAEAKRETEDLSAEMATVRNDWAAEQARRDAAVKAVDESEQQRQKRLRDEFNYVFARDQKTMRDQLADEKAKLEREVEEKKRGFEQAASERERQLSAREGELAMLAKRVDNFPGELDAAVKKAIDAETRQIKSDGANREELLKRDFAAERNVLTTRVDALETALKDRDMRIEKLLTQLDKAQSLVHETALRSIDGASSNRTLGELQQRLVDSARSERSGEGSRSPASGPEREARR